MQNKNIALDLRRRQIIMILTVILVIVYAFCIYLTVLNPNDKEHHFALVVSIIPVAILVYLLERHVLGYMFQFLRVLFRPITTSLSGHPTYILLYGLLIFFVISQFESGPPKWALLFNFHKKNK